MASTDFTFDTINRLSTLTHKQGTTTLAGYTYAYDGLSRPTSIDSTIEGVSAFTYDATSQLTVADHATQSDEAYGFDANGNRNTTGYTTGTNNQTTAGLGFTYTYDDEGNRLTRTETSTGKVQSYEWDYRNRLVAVKDRNTSGGSVVKQVNYEYDAFNRLVHREYDADGAGSGAATNQYWIYDEGINAILQFDGSAASNLAHRYLWSNQVDELLADEQATSLSTGGNTLWGLGDHLGTLRDIADLNEGTGVTSVTNHRTYNVFGKLTAETNSAVDLLFGFTGKQLDDATGLQHNLYRWYDSAIGQWMSEDPIGFNAGDENLKRYVGNRVSSVLDPAGLDWLDNYAHWYEAQFGTAGTVATNVALGVVVGAATAAAVTVAAPIIATGDAAVLVAGGVSAGTATTVATGTVTALIFTGGVVGGITTGVSTVRAYNEGDWNQVGYNVGTLGGGLTVGISRGRPMVEKLTGIASESPQTWNPITILKNEWALGYKLNGEYSLFSFEFWATAPTPVSGGTAAGLTPGIFTIVDWLIN